MSRPAVDVVIPFAGPDTELRDLTARAKRIRLGSDDTLTIVDNRRNSPQPDDAVVITAPERQSSYFARNRGAARGSNDWLLFIDADVEFPDDLIDRYFDPAPGEESGLVAGAVQVTPAYGGPVERYGILRQHVSDESAASREMAYAQTANVLVRRHVFDELGGFVDNVRSGGDADFSFRAQRAGWSLERRASAPVSHPPRHSLKAMLRQVARYGSSAAWLNERYPGFATRTPWIVVARGVLSGVVKAPLAALRGDRDRALLLALDPVVAAATEVGRRISNEVAPAQERAVPDRAL